MKDMIEFLANYPLWVKIAVLVLGAGIGFLLVAFRPSSKTESEPRVLRIERIESSGTYTRIRLEIIVNGKSHSFPETYEYARFEPNMSGGEYRLTTADDFVIEIKMKTQTDVTRPGENTPRTVLKEFQTRQPMRLSAKDLPRQGTERIRPVVLGAQGPPQDDIVFTYSLR